LVQSIMWPCVARLQSVVGVSGPCHGKTLGWLIPLLNSLANRAQYRQLNQHHAPLAIVLCPGLKCASIVFKLIQDISSKARLGLKVLLASAGAKHTEPSDYIGLDVLVTAPAWLIQLIGQRYTSMNRCCHLVVEEGDRTLYMWQKEVDEIMVSWHKHDSSLPYQLIIVAERWNHYVEQFTRTFMVEGSSPVVVLGNLMEAVIYGKVDMVPEFTTNVTDKISRVVKLMKARDKTKRMVICCKDFNMGVMVSKFCEEVTVLHSGLDKSKTKLIFDMWCLIRPS
jgi:superfamily II DNA/RNA helicase